MGITDASELQYCSAKDLSRLADTLKEIPKRRFRELVKKLKKVKDKAEKNPSALEKSKVGTKAPKKDVNAGEVLHGL